MANFLRDNADLRYYLDKGIDWASLVELTEYEYRSEGGFTDAEEARSFYADILELVGDFTANEIDPHVAQIDREGVLFEDGEARFPERLQSIFDKINELELHSMCLPRELGGMNCPVLLYMMTTEIIGRADASVMAHYSFHGGIALALLFYSMMEGSTEFTLDPPQITSTRFGEAIDEIRRGAAWGSMDITEPSAGSDMAAMRTVAKQRDDGSWVVSGQKIFITSGHGKYHVVIARTADLPDGDDAFSGLGALSTFLVPAYEDLPDGSRKWLATVDRIEEKLGHHGSATCAITYDETPAHLIGEVGSGFKQMLLLMNNARVGVGLESIGLCEAAWRLAKAYAAERPSMGKTIDRHEMIADYLDDMETTIRGLRALAYDAAFHEEMGQKLKVKAKYLTEPGSVASRQVLRESARHQRASRAVTPLLKYLAAEKAVEMGRLCVQIHGGVGFTKEYGAEKLLRDAMVFPIYEGTSQIQALMVMKDALVGIMKRPQAFVKGLAQNRWLRLSAKDPLERKVARIQGMALSAQQHLLTRTAAGKLREVAKLPMSQWQGSLFKDWDPKRDFALAMLHAERLCRIMADAAICERLLTQAQQHPERRELLERYAERAEPRCRFLLEEITTTGARLLAQLAETEAPAAQAS